MKNCRKKSFTRPFFAFLFILAAFFICLGVVYLSPSINSPSAAAGSEFDPLDWLGEKDGFAITVGQNNGQGRYWTYHYNFAD